MTIEIFIIILFVMGLSSLVKGWSGFGTNLIAMPFLISFLQYPSHQAVPIVISINVFMNIAILIENKKFNIKSLDRIKWLAVIAIVFTFIGQYFLKNPDNAMYVKIISGTLIVLTGINKIIQNHFGTKEVFHEDTMHRYYIPLGILSGLFNGISGLGGLPILVLLSNSNLKKEEFRTTLVSYFFVMNIVAIVGFIINGQYTPIVLTHVSYFVIPSVILCMIGIYLSRRVSDKIFSRVMLGVLLFMGFNLLINGITGNNILDYLFI